MNLQTQIRVEAVKTALKNGERNIDITTKFCDEWCVSAPAVIRVIGMAKRELLVEMQEKKKIIERVRRKEIKEAAQGDIVSELEADTILCNIILGKTTVRKIYNTVNGIVEKEVPPDHATILKALDMYYKRMGSYRVNEEEEEDRKDVDRVTGLVLPCEECPMNPNCTEQCDEREIFLEAGGDKTRWPDNMKGTRATGAQKANEQINADSRFDSREAPEINKTVDTSTFERPSIPPDKLTKPVTILKRPFPPLNNGPRVRNYPVR